MAEQLRGPFEKFVDSELRGGAVTMRCTSNNVPQTTSRKRKRSKNVSPRTFQTALIVAPPSYKGFF
jgi:hypothetical protein